MTVLNVNFQEERKKYKKNKETRTEKPSDVFFDSTNRLHDAKLSGVLGEDELSKVLILEGKIFSNQVNMGLRTEEDVEDYERILPRDKNEFLKFNHKDLDLAYNTIKQGNTAALLGRESYNKEAQAVKKLVS